MTARVGPGLARPPYHAISPSRRGFPRVNSGDTFVVATVCNPSVGGEHPAPIRGKGEPATARFLSVSLPSAGRDGYCITVTCNSVIKQTLKRRIENADYLRHGGSYLGRWRCSPRFSFGQALVGTERPVGGKEMQQIAISGTKTDCRLESPIQASEGPTSRSAKTYLRRSCTFSSVICASTEQQRTAL